MLLSVIKQPSEENIDNVSKWVNNKTKGIVKQNVRAREIKILDRIETLATTVFIPSAYAFFTGLFLLFMLVISVEGKSNLEIYIEGLLSVFLLFFWLFYLDDLIKYNFLIISGRLLGLILYSIIFSILIINSGWSWVIVSIVFVAVSLLIFIRSNVRYNSVFKQQQYL